MDWFRDGYYGSSASSGWLNCQVCPALTPKNKMLLAHRWVHLFMYCLGLLFVRSRCNIFALWPLPKRLELRGCSLQCPTAGSSAVTCERSLQYPVPSCLCSCFCVCHSTAHSASMTRLVRGPSLQGRFPMLISLEYARTGMRIRVFGKALCETARYYIKAAASNIN